MTNKELATVTLGGTLEEKEKVDAVELWTENEDKNPILVDRLGYVPREKIIARGIANGEILEAYRRSPEYLRQFDEAYLNQFDDKLVPEPDISAMDIMESADAAKSNALTIKKLSENVQKSRHVEKPQADDSVKEPEKPSESSEEK